MRWNPSLLTPLFRILQPQEKETLCEVVQKGTLEASPVLPILEKIAKTFSEKQSCLVAIDGRAAAGKTTLAKQLQVLLPIEVIHMDDFFLPPVLRTAQRYAEVGGNVHYERFREEVLPYLSLPNAFSYRMFDCGQMAYTGERKIRAAKLRIVEGCYSCHPAFGQYADVTVFLDVAPKEQLQRIRERNGAEAAERFRTQWIPLEEAYFQQYRIAEKAELRFQN